MFLFIIEKLLHILPSLTDRLPSPTFQANEVMEEFEKTIAQLKLQLLDAEHQRHQQVRVRFPGLVVFISSHSVAFTINEGFVLVFLLGLLLGSRAEVPAAEG